MRIYLQLSKNKTTIPFNYQQFLMGAIHKWIGNNNTVHGTASLYSFSWFQNVDTTKNGLNTKAASYFFISAHDNKIIKAIIKGIMADASVCFGINVTDVQIQEDPTFTSGTKFFVSSPIFIKRRFDGKELHILFNDQNSSKYLTETIQKKATLANINHEGLSISFDANFLTPRSKVIYYKDIGNKVNICPVIIEGSPEQIAFAWNVGVGNSTGIGFGSLK